MLRIVAALLLSSGLISAQNTFWTSNTVPTTPSISGDNAPVTLGLPFYSSVAGQVTGGRFYKGSYNPGPHTVALFNANGQVLAQGTTQNETFSGWQTVTFASPVNITASAKYVIAYFAPQGGYADDQNYPWKNLSRPPLHVTSLDNTASSGTFAYGSALAFPKGKWNRSNYWVDVLFYQGSAPPPPTTSTYTVSGMVTGTYSATLTMGNSTASIDSSGTYSFANVANGTYTITPSSSGYTFSPTSASVTVNGANVSGINFTATASTPPPGHSVTLNWTASTSPNISGYKVYVSSTSGGPYQLVTSTLISGTNYVDTSVTAGTVYYFVCTAVDSSNTESGYSNEAQATVPTP